MTVPNLPRPITARELAEMLHAVIGAAVSRDMVEEASVGGVAGERGYGEFIVTTPATWQRFRVTVAPMSEEVQS